MPVHFLQVLREVSGIFHALPAEAVSMVIATSTECRNIAHSLFKGVTLSDPGQLTDLLRVSRPFITRVMLDDQNRAAGQVLYAPGDIAMVNGSFSRLRDVYLSFGRLGPSAVSLLVSVHAPRLQVLHLDSNDLGAEGMQQLAKGDWPLLKNLQLSCTRIDAQAMAELIKGNWPKLQTLNLRENKLNLQAADYVGAAAGSYPRMESIDLSGNMLNLCLGRVLKASSSWLNLKSLDMSCCNLETSDMQSLVTAQLPQLNNLNLDHNLLNFDAMKQLILGQWPLLAYLSIINLKMSASSVALLQSACWSLKGLRVAKSRVVESFKQEVYALTQAKWPDLECLSLGVGHHTTMARLCKGNWPLLQRLDVSVDAVDALLVETLLSSSWPCLESLGLSTYSMSPDGFQFFGIVFEQFPTLQQDFDNNTLITLSEFSNDGLLPKGSAACALWPCLKCLLLRKKNVSENNMSIFDIDIGNINVLHLLG